MITLCKNFVVNILIIYVNCMFRMYPNSPKSAVGGLRRSSSPCTMTTRPFPAFVFFGLGNGFRLRKVPFVLVSITYNVPVLAEKEIATCLRDNTASSTTTSHEALSVPILKESRCAVNFCSLGGSAAHIADRRTTQPVLGSVRSTARTFGTDEPHCE